MNTIQADFSSLPEEYQVRVLSFAAEPVAPRPSNVSWELSENVNNSLRGSFLGLSRMATVCQDWWRLQQDDCVWKAVFDRCLESLRYDIDFSPGESCLGKVKLFIETMEGHRDFFMKCAAPHKFSLYVGNQPFKSEKLLSCVARLNHSCRIQELFKMMIAGKDFKNLASLLLFNHKIEYPSLIASKLTTSPSSRHLKSTQLCLDIMIKLHYDLSSFFRTYTTPSEKYVYSVSQFVQTLFSDVNELSITDYLASGCDFHAVEVEGQVSLFSLTARYLVRLFYRTGTFQIHPAKAVEVANRPYFTDELLQKHIRKAPISEEEVKNLVLDLLTKTHLDLNMVGPRMRIGVESGPALSQLRQLASSPHLAQPNAFSEALKEYDQKL
jgi:hypothetical protein